MSYRNGRRRLESRSSDDSDIGKSFKPATIAEYSDDSDVENLAVRPTIIDSSDEEDGFEISSENAENKRRPIDFTEKNYISDSDEEQDIGSSTNGSAARLSVDVSADGRNTPMIEKAIRRSIFRIQHESDSDEPSAAADDDEVENVSDAEEEAYVASSDVEADVAVNAVKGDYSSGSSEDSVKVLPEIINASTSNGNSNTGARKSVHADIILSSDDDDIVDNSAQSIVTSESSIDHSAIIRDDSEINSSANLSSEAISDTSGNQAAYAAAKEETGNAALDPMLAQKRALLVFEQQKLETRLAKTKKLLAATTVQMLPDGGEKLRLSLASTEEELYNITEKLRKMPIQSESAQFAPPQRSNDVKPMFKQNSLEIDPQYLKPAIGQPERELGKKALDTLNREQSLTIERLQDMHGSLVARPTEDQRAKDPRGLNIKLMAHQQHALAWLLWREQQKPRGGVLADDMGLGKTLTMISLVMEAKAAREDSDDEEEDWKTSSRGHLGGTLVVAPASLVSQWESEIKNRCKRGMLVVELYHGANREKNAKRLARNDIVITTYNILTRGFKDNGTIFKIHWRRIILDEAHVIRNHKSQTCEAVCGLNGNARWALTGTPIHNKEIDLYSILKFLRCSPFDDLRVWKRWVDNKNAAGHERLATVMKTLMLRRTKQELIAKGGMQSLPAKTIEVIDVKLDDDERLVYDKVMVYSRTLFAQFLAQRAEKQHMFELGAGHYDKPSWETNHRTTQFTKAQNQLLSMHADVKSHEILVLLLRLRQVCCHPSLIHSMLDQEDIEAGGAGEGAADVDLMARMNNMSLIGDGEDEGEVGVDERIAEHLLTSDNPVFDPNRRSSKMRAVLEKVEEILANHDKVIIVSQWVGVLEIVENELSSVERATVRIFNGKVPVKDRQGIMDEFNSPREKANVLLLSLTAGGVGLNLVGANHLLLIDIHWNPQLESQAQDRIYRFGQTKDVFIYKYICTDTIEERIKALQDKKLEVAQAVLTGGRAAGGSKLSLDDIKSLFGL